jgi:hypothetical protein
MVPLALGLVAFEGIAFLPEVAEACLGVGVTCSCNRREPCLPLLMLCTLTCIYVPQITGICFVYVLGMVWVLRTVEIVLYRACTCIERVHRRVTYKVFST